MNLEFSFSDTGILPSPFEYESNGEGSGGGRSKAKYVGSSTAYAALIINRTHVTVCDEIDSIRLADQMPIVSARRRHAQTYFDLLASAHKQPISILNHVQEHHPSRIHHRVRYDQPAKFTGAFPEVRRAS